MTSQQLSRARPWCWSSLSWRLARSNTGGARRRLRGILWNPATDVAWYPRRVKLSGDSNRTTSSSWGSAPLYLTNQGGNVSVGRCFSTTKPETTTTGTGKTTTTSTEETESTTTATDATLRSEEQKKSTRLFTDVAEISSDSQRALREILKVGPEMTEIQHESFDAVFAGRDVLGRARTGTGKTLAFLLPALERMAAELTTTMEDDLAQRSTMAAQILILSPTRELALQTFQQARGLLTFFSKPPWRAQVMYGGTKQRTRYDDMRMFQRNLPPILVATPGRLRDHLKHSFLLLGPGRTTKVFFADVLRQNVQVLVLDETDRALLQMGFQQDLRDVLEALPSTKQTLLFSATLPPALGSLLQSLLKPNHVKVDCIVEEDPTTHTNQTTRQYHVLLPSPSLRVGLYDYAALRQTLLSSKKNSSVSNNNNNNNNNSKKKNKKNSNNNGNELSRPSWIATTVRLIVQYMDADPTNKIMVFFPTAALVAYFAEVFRYGLRRSVLELHSRKTQSHRIRASEQFREQMQGITLFTTDVSARGMDYPQVTHVLQIGMASSRATYIHRLGRTGRAGEKGESILVLTELERRFLKELKGLDIPLHEGLTDQLLSWQEEEEEEDKDDDEVEAYMKLLRQAQTSHLDLQVKAQNAYLSMLAYYSNGIRWIAGAVSARKRKAVDGVIAMANSFAAEAGLKELPILSLERAQELELVGVPGLRIVKNDDDAKTAPPQGKLEQGGEGPGGLKRSKRIGLRKKQGVEEEEEEEEEEILSSLEDAVDWDAFSGTGSYDDWGKFGGG